MNWLFRHCILISFIFCLSSLSGQTYLGLSAGYQITYPVGGSSSPHLNSEIDYENSFFASFDYREIHSKSFAMKASILYVQQNAEFHLSSGGLGGNITTDATVNYGYLDFCFFPEFSFGNKARFYLDFGPYLGVLLYSDLTGTAEWWKMGAPPNTGSRELSGSAKDYLNNLTIGFQLGIGFRYMISEKVTIHAGVNERISTIDIDTGGDGKFLTNLIFAAGVDFKISDKTRPRMNWAHE